MRIRADVQVTDNTAIATRQLRRQLGAVVRKAAFDVEARAKLKAPVDTGHLRNSISVRTGGQIGGDGGALDALSAEVVATAEYAAYVELGTNRHKAQPFMEPAAEEVRPQFEEAVKRVLRQIGVR
jgi:HK97 gp10 family phage protein